MNGIFKIAKAINTSTEVEPIVRKCAIRDPNQEVREVAKEIITKHTDKLR